jgi:hypothetical protein
MNVAEEKNTLFNYLLNAMEHASQEKNPAKAGYAGKRKALLAHVRELERKAAAYDAHFPPGATPPAAAALGDGGKQ